MQEESDEQAAQQLTARRPQLLREVGALCRRRAEQGGAAHGGSPGSVALAERGLERMAELLAAERLGLEERQLPAVESVTEARVVVRYGEPDPYVARHRGAEGIEPRRLAGRSGRRDRQNRADPVRPPVEPLEQDRSRGDRSRGREPDRRDRVRELGRRVGCLVRPARERALELEHAGSVRLAAEVPRQQPRGLGPHRRELARGGHPHADPVAELDLRADGEADQRRHCAVRMALAVERAFELLVGAREGGVVPVEAAAALGGAHEKRHEHAAVDRAGLVSHVSLMSVGKDPRRRLAQQVGDGVLHVDPREEPLGPRLDEAAHERAVLVERRSAVRAVLLEGEREVDAVLELAREDGEGAEAEATERVVEVRRAHPALLRRRRVASYLTPRAPVRKCARFHPAARSGRRCHSEDGAGRAGRRDAASNTVLQARARPRTSASPCIAARGCGVRRRLCRRRFQPAGANLLPAPREAYD